MAVVAASQGPSDAERIAVMAVPATLAVGLVQLRERSSLLTRLLRGWNAAMLISLALVWVVVFSRL
jgi:hypothetical protein